MSKKQHWIEEFARHNFAHVNDIQKENECWPSEFSHEYSAKVVNLWTVSKDVIPVFQWVTANIPMTASQQVKLGDALAKLWDALEIEPTPDKEREK